MAKAIEIYIEKLKRGEDVQQVQLTEDDAKEEFIRTQQNKLAKKSRTRSTSAEKGEKTEKK